MCEDEMRLRMEKSQQEIASFIENAAKKIAVFILSLALVKQSENKMSNEGRVHYQQEILNDFLLEFKEMIECVLKDFELNVDEIFEALKKQMQEISQEES